MNTDKTTLTLYRFCSKEEATKLFEGKTLTNTTDHYRNGRGGSTSRGFCLTEDSPETAWPYLKGIVTPGVCMKLEIPSRLLTESSGKYAGKSVSSAMRTVVEPIIRKEWCIRTLLPGWLKEVIALESFVPDYELEAVRYYDRQKKQIMKQYKIRKS